MLNPDKIKYLLNHYDIQYLKDGKNISPGNIGIQCPYCSDESTHCGIRLTDGVFYCWRCSESGNFFRLLRKLAGISWREYELLIERSEISFRQSALEQAKQLIMGNRNIVTSKEKRIKEVKLPKFAVPVKQEKLNCLLTAFLRRRKFVLHTPIKYGCFICTVGNYANRLIIPVYFKSKLVAFQAADMTGRAFLKYRTTGDINNYLYGIPYLDIEVNKLILVEGVFDVWRLGENTLCSFGTHITKEQRSLILELVPKELVFAWDGDAYLKARSVAKRFLPFIDKVKVVQLPRGEDPDSYGRVKTLELLEKTGWL